MKQNPHILEGRGKYVILLSAKRTQYAKRLLALQFGDDASDSTPFIFSKNRLMTRSLKIERREMEQLRRRF